MLQITVVIAVLTHFSPNTIIYPNIPLETLVNFWSSNVFRGIETEHQNKSAFSGYFAIFFIFLFLGNAVDETERQKSKVSLSSSFGTIKFINLTKAMYRKTIPELGRQSK